MAPCLLHLSLGLGLVLLHSLLPRCQCSHPVVGHLLSLLSLAALLDGNGLQATDKVPGEHMDRVPCSCNLLGSNGRQASHEAG